MTALDIRPDLVDEILRLADACHLSTNEVIEILLANSANLITNQHQSATNQTIEQIEPPNSVVVFLYDSATLDLLYVSSTYEEIIGYPLSKAYEGVNEYLDVVYPDDHSYIKNIFEQRAHGIYKPHEYRIVKANGTVCWVRSITFKFRASNSDLGQIVEIIEDITEYKLAQVDLYKAELKLKTLLEVLPVGISLLGKRSQIVEVNPALETILDISKADLFAGKYTQRKYVDQYGMPLDANDFPSTRARIEQRTISDFEIGVIKENGETIWTSVSAAPLPLPEYSTVVVTQDITQRKKVEGDALVREAYLNTLTNSLADAIFTVKMPERHISYANETIQEIFGYTRAEVIGEQTRKFYADEESFLSFGHKLQETLARGHKQLITEHQLMKKNGDLFWASIATTFVHSDDRLVEVISIVRDITTQRRLQEEFRIYHSAMEASQDLMIVADADYKYVAVNQAYLNYHQCLREEVIGKTLSNILGENYFQSIIKQRFDRCLAGELQNFEAGFIYPQGPRNIHVSYSPLVDHEGDISKVIIMIRDITDYKQMEQQAFALKLEQEQVKILANFIQDASHEFRTPLSIMQISLYLLNRADDPAQRSAKIMQIENQISRITRLVDTLVTMITLDSNTGIPLGEVDINQVISTVVSKEQTMAADKKQMIHLNLSELPLILGNAQYLGEAFQHVLHNAICYTPTQGVITIHSVCTAKTIIIDVQDTGAGIHISDIPHIYDRFYRADTAHSTAGFGLGLTIAQKVIKAHQGSIEISNRDDGGCLVRIELPVS